MFAPQSVAVVGASGTPGKAGFAMFRALATAPVPVYPVNPRGGRLGGHAVLADVRDAPGPVDLAVLVVPAPAVPGVLGRCAAAGVRAAVVCSGGFAEAGADGARLQDEAARVAAEGGIRLLGPNTSGFLNPAAGILASFVPGVEQIRPGPVAVVASSGGVQHAAAFACATEGLGVCLGVGLGNAADVGAADVLDHVADAGEARVVALHLESIGDGRHLFEAVARTTGRLPVVALVAGRAAADFARSHTGRLAGDWRRARAALAQAGAVLVEDLTELVDAAAAMARVRLPAAAEPGVGVVTGQAGPGLLLADRLGADGVAVPALSAAIRRRLGELLPPLTYQANPVDTGRPGPSFGAVLGAVAADPAVDVVLAYALHEPDVLDPRAAIAAARSQSGTPVVFGTGGPATDVAVTTARLAEDGVPAFPAPERAARAVRALVADARASTRRRAAPEAGFATASQGPDRLGPGPLDEVAAKVVLEGLGVRTPARRVCRDRAAAHAALAELGPPVVVKTLDPYVVHKSEAGGVHLGVVDGAALDVALDALGRPPAVLLEREAPPGPELLVGGVRDRSFGPVVVLGMGGTTAEVLDDVAVRLAPLGPAEAATMLGELRGRRLVMGHRGAPAVDPAELAGLVAAVGDLLVAHPEVDELDVNPLRVTAAGLVALDAVVLLRDAAHEEGGGDGGRA